MSKDRFTTSESMNANETIILDNGVPSIHCTDLVTHADYAAAICRGLNVLDKNGMLPTDGADEVDTILVPTVPTRDSGKVAGRMSSSEH